MRRVRPVAMLLAAAIPTCLGHVETAQASTTDRGRPIFTGTSVVAGDWTPGPASILVPPFDQLREFGATLEPR